MRTMKSTNLFDVIVHPAFSAPDGKFLVIISPADLQYCERSMEMAILCFFRLCGKPNCNNVENEFVIILKIDTSDDSSNIIKIS